MINTGERLVTGGIGYVSIEHLHRYALALEFVSGKVVLDVASGEGYGSNLLAGKAKMVHGVDFAEIAVSHARNKYSKSNLIFHVGNAVELPFDDNTFDIVVSFETIEHLDKHSEMIQEIRRVLKKDGMLIISSPDKLNYSDRSGYKNPFHVKELYFEEFAELLESNFRHVSYFFQKIQIASFMVNPNKSDYQGYQGNFEKIEKIGNITQPVYNIAICSDIQIDEAISSWFDASEAYENHLHMLIQENNEIRNSKTYKLGKFISAPYRMLRALLK